MKDEELKKKLEELAENEEIISELRQVESKDDLQKTLNKFGIDFSREEIDCFAEGIEKILSSDEMYENELEQVSGGFAISGFTIISSAISWGKSIWKAAWKLGKKFANWEDRR